jgi:trehalose 2-sulfotransferase
MSPIRYLYGAPTTSYLVCTTPRSGSTFLCQALASTGVAGRPEEYFQQLAATGLPRRPADYLEGRMPAPPGAPDGDHRVDPLFDPRRFAAFDDYMSWVLGTGTTNNGVFGAKIMSAYVGGLVAGLTDALGERAPKGTPALLAAVFPRLRYIFLVRDDKVRQAVSLWRAIQSWHWREDGAGADASGDGALRYSFEALDHLRGRLQAEEEWWRRYFADAGIEPLTIVYEDFADSHDEAVRAVLAHLEIPFDGGWALPSPTMRRQSDSLSREWAERYAAEAGAVAQDASP